MTYVRNIKAVLACADSTDWAEGTRWYADARTFCSAAAKKYGLPLLTVVAVIAALSPRNRWERNLADALAVLEGAATDTTPQKCGTFKKNVVKALSIARTGDTTILKGRKVSSFADNIVNPQSQLVTVDVWAARIARGDIYAPPSAIPEADYDLIEVAYQQVAAEYGCPPSVVQAVAWVTARRLVKAGAHVGQLPLL